VYDKSAEYNLCYNLLRIEKRVKKNEYLRKKGIRTLSDLLEDSSWFMLSNDLMNSISEFIIVDELEPDKKINDIQKPVWSKLINPKLWDNYRLNTRHKKSRLKVQAIDLIQLKKLDTKKKKLIILMGTELIDIYNSINESATV